MVTNYILNRESQNTFLYHSILQIFFKCYKVLINRKTLKDAINEKTFFIKTVSLFLNKKVLNKKLNQIYFVTLMFFIIESFFE